MNEMISSSFLIDMIKERKERKRKRARKPKMWKNMWFRFFFLSDERTQEKKMVIIRGKQTTPNNNIRSIGIWMKSSKNWNNFLFLHGRRMYARTCLGCLRELPSNKQNHYSKALIRKIKKKIGIAERGKKLINSKQSNLERLMHKSSNNTVDFVCVRVCCMYMCVSRCRGIWRTRVVKKQGRRRIRAE